MAVGLERMSAAHAVKYSAGPTRATGGVATFIHKACLTNKDDIDVQIFQAGRAIRCYRTNGEDEFVVWNIHDFGLDTE
eukprot:8153282-Karenia_brevis.AAC.1